MLGFWWLGLVLGLVTANVPREDVRVGAESLTSEHTRRHAFPEILYVVNGTLEWTQEAEPFTATAGTVVLVPENVTHTLAPRGGATLAYFRWAPGGDIKTLHRQSTMTEPVATHASGEAVGVRRYESGPPDNESSHSHIDDVEWTTNFTYSEELWKVYRYKPLVREALLDWRGVTRDEVRMGLQELEPGAAYPTHHHPSPEVYMVLSGNARWRVGETSVDAEPGTVIYTPPNTRHRIENTGGEHLRWLYFWWAPNGDTSVLE